MNDIKLMPGDHIELKFICEIDEVKFTRNGGYIIRARCAEGPKEYSAMEIDMNKAGNFVKKIAVD